MRTYPDPLARRWARRSVSISLVTLAFLLLAVLSPVWVVGCALLDLLFRGKIASLRGTAFVFCYLYHEMFGLALCLWAWLRYGRNPRAFHEAMFRAQFIWGERLVRTCVKLLGLRIHVESDYAFGGRRVILAARHTSIADTLVPMAYVCIPYNLKLLYVMKRELEWDPCIDFAVSRLPHLFVIRGSGDASREIEAIGRRIEERDDGVIIFPEGTRYSPRKRERVLQKLQESGDGDLLHWARAHSHVIPLRLGGMQALLERNRDADVVFCAHRGFENASSFREAFNGSLIDADIYVKFWGVPFEEIPATKEERRAWLLEQWARVDDFAAGREQPAQSPAPAVAQTGGSG